MIKTVSARERILAAAFELISSKGFLGASTREIAERANVAEVTIFRHFTCKEKLFDAIASRFFVVSELEELLPSLLDKPLGEGIAILAATYIDKLSGFQIWHRIYHSELQRKSEKFPLLCQLYMDCLFEVCNGYLSRAAQRGEMRCYDSATTAKIFIMFCSGYHQANEILLRNGHQDDDRKHLVDELAEIFVSGVTNHALKHTMSPQDDIQSIGPGFHA